MEQQSNILEGRKGGIPAKERRKKIEDREQVELFRFLGKFKDRYSQLKWVHPSGNDAGVWNIFVPCPRLVPPGLTAHGMYLEMKTGIGKLSIDQEYFGNTMKRAGYVCVVVASWHEAARAILEYLADCPAALKALPDAAPGTVSSKSVQATTDAPTGKPTLR